MDHGPWEAPQEIPGDFQEAHREHAEHRAHNTHREHTDTETQSDTQRPHRENKENPTYTIYWGGAVELRELPIARSSPLATRMLAHMRGGEDGGKAAKATKAKDEDELVAFAKPEV